ncbi:hypothetical protein F0919_13780 [Taibaiella lutea]|uniref:Outer membrane protein beta-barrel domain-containing protein n=1 Tax=Taibaiella lutea TaxID=2608001 RepID=A0A5M6CEK3_9BACT|nr:hypothetical protein [Taibaiella lutea]KAA5533604.1 hypothetical protein F0919_13780 [Taibaiella lutea]
MRKSLQSIFIAGLMTAGITTLTAIQASAQDNRYEKNQWRNSHHYDWGNPDIPYIEQRGFSIGFNIGQADLWGDVGTKGVIDHYNNNVYTKDIFKSMRFMGGMFVRYTYIPGISFRLGVNYGSLYATDEWNTEKALKATYISDDYYQRYVRNLDVKTNIWESNFLVEISPLRLSNWEFGKLSKMRFQPYILVGFGGFFFNPRGTVKDLETGVSKTVDLQPLRTEGEGFNAPGKTFPKSYSLFSYAGIGGIGFKFDVGKGLGLGLEYQLRYTFTDYLDDVSGAYIDPLDQQVAFLGNPGKADLSNKMSDRSSEIIAGNKNKAGSLRGNPDNKDMYSTVSIMFYWKIKKRNSPWWSTY